jgi:hypothetical protein
MEAEVIQNSKNFYELKQKAILLLVKIERSFDVDVKDIEKFASTLKKLKVQANEQNYIYFEERLKTIQDRFNSFLEKRKDTKKDLNKIYNLFEKIKDDKRSKLINSKLINDLSNKKISISPVEKKDKKINSLDSYLIMHFQKSIFIVPDVKKKIIKNISYKTKYLAFKKQKISIFPLSPIGDDKNDDSKKVSQILVLSTLEGYKCIRFDDLIQQENFDNIEFNERKIESGSIYEDLKYFIRWRGRNCFFLNYKRISSFNSF